MSWRGSAAYYLAAWICGGTFASAAIWIRHGGAASSILAGSPAGAGFFFFCFVGLILGFLPALLEALLLWLVARTFRLRGALAWALAAAIVAVGVTVVLGRIGGGGIGGTERRDALALLTQGPALLVAGGWWMPVIPGALTGVVLSRIEQAFSVRPLTKEDSGPPPPSDAAGSIPEA
jgi:hypothetical protein